MKNKNLYRFFSFGLALALSFSGCAVQSVNDEEEVQVVIPEYEKNTYRTKKIKKGTIQPTLKLTLTPDAFEVKSYSIKKETLTVSSLNVEEGDNVKAGEVMVVFKNDDIKDHIKEYKNRKEEDAILIAHYKKLQRIEGSKKYEDEIQKLIADQKVADLYIKEQREMLKSYEIRAERDGVVTMVSEDLYKGTASFGSPIISVASGSSNYTASTKDAYPFKKDEIYKATLNDIVYKMKVLHVKKEGDTQNIVFKPVSAMAGITESDTLDMKIRKPSIDNATYVEEEAIQTVEDKTYVFVLDDKGYREAVEVKIMDTIDGYAVISQGIEAGEQVTIQ